MDEIWNPMEKAHVQNMLKYSFVGSQETVKTQLKEFQRRFQVNEMMITSAIYEPEARINSYAIFKNAVDELNGSI